MTEPVLYESNYYEKDHLINSCPPILPKDYSEEDLYLLVDQSKRKKCPKAKRQIDEASSHVNSNHTREGTFQN